MKTPTLTFGVLETPLSPKGAEASVPDILGSFNLQNKNKFVLDEDDELFEGYGRVPTAYPYRQYTCYDRRFAPDTVQTAVLENEFLRAVFLPEFGGRLWELIDKTRGVNLLYTNDIIRPSNLAIRNAWFSGGVEWNISMIGHTPLTMEPLFTATLEQEDGTPVLRMYEYERLRGVTYQMEFWLGKTDRFLNCRMRILNDTAEVLPMYWWSNMAVPEYESGRIVTPASEAYTFHAGTVYKVATPLVEGVDISRYCDIPSQVDYFFNISKEEPKYIANLDASGYGLLHLSTSRLQSRKLFSWGNNPASQSWQNFLTEKAGHYVEIQAGLAKTQYGCLPMPPHTAWEWIEQYGAVEVDPALQAGDYEALRREMTERVSRQLAESALEARLAETRALAKSPAQLISSGSGFGALEALRRTKADEPPLPAQLDFGAVLPAHAPWVELLTTGLLPEIAPEDVPADFLPLRVCHAPLCRAAEQQEHWYLRYLLGIDALVAGELATAQTELTRSLALCPNAWAHHALAVLELARGNCEAAAAEMTAGLALRREDLSYCKEALRILLLVGADSAVLAAYDALPPELAADSRLLFDRITALHHLGRSKEAFALLEGTPRFVLDDLRECEDSLGDLWQKLHTELFGTPGNLPAEYDFDSLRYDEPFTL